jgi:hypothetical protein
VVLTRVAPKWKARPSELITIFSMLAVGALYISWSLMTWFFVQIATPGLKALVNAHTYKSIVGEMFPDWFFVKDTMAVLGFWRGNTDSVPWGAWIVPFIMWTLLFAVALFVTMCVANLVYDRWNEAERLRFPLAIPIVGIATNTTEHSEAPREVPIWRNVLLWGGLALSGIVWGVLPGIQQYFPGWAVPSVLSGIPVSDWLANSGVPDAVRRAIWMHGGFRFKVLSDPIALGVAWFVPQDILLTVFVYSWLWFAWLSITIATGLSAGSFYSMYDGHWAGIQELGYGAFVGLGIIMFWWARRDIVDIVKRAFVKPNPEKDAKMGLSPKQSVLGIIIGMTIILAFMRVLGIRIGWGLYFMATYLVFSLVSSRLRTESGLPTHYGAHWGPFQGLVGQKSLIGLQHFWSTLGHAGNAGAMPMPTILEGYFMCDKTGASKRKFSFALIAAMLIACVSVFVILLPMYYEKGAFNFLWQWEASHVDDLYTDAIEGYDALSENLNLGIRIPVTLIGTAVVLITGVLRASFMWWPFSPVGAVGAFHMRIGDFWPAFFIIWVVKSLMIRYAGAKILKKAEPFFIGMIIGQPLVRAFFVVLAWIVK